VARVAVAAPSQLAADGAAEVAEAGGNAVDCALAAALVAMNTEPGVCALAGGAYVTVSAPGEAAVTFDGNVAVPGKGRDPALRGRGTALVTMDYGGGITTLVGAGAVAVPGSLAAVDAASRRYGQCRWDKLLAPSVRAAREGFPLSAACHYYLRYSGEPVFGRSEDGYAALHDGDGLRSIGERIRVPHLADSLELIARDGASAMYTGELAAAIAAHCEAGDGALTLADLAEYRAVARPALLSRIGDWHIATNPPPAVGGAVLSAMLLLSARDPRPSWDADSIAGIIRIQRDCLDYRRQHLDLADDAIAAADALLDAARHGGVRTSPPSASTIHTSAVDADGLACAVTASSGYGAGEMPPGTGLWLNNCVGELELNRRGLDAGPVGARLPSNMAPTVAGDGERVLAIGSPGADRITTALHQVLVNLIVRERSLAEAVAMPRVHVDMSGSHDRLMAEPGIPLPGVDLPVVSSDECNMYFGGVAAAMRRPGGFDVAADPRREGAVLLA